HKEELLSTNERLPSPIENTRRDVIMEANAALITGASKGLGKALFLDLAKRGVRVVGVARNAAEMQRVVDEARAAGGKAFGFAADVGEQGAAARIAAEAAQLAGDIDVVVHNASTLGPVPLLPLVDV